MESFYSIIYYKTNTVTDEYLAIGLFCGGGEGPFFYLSDRRLKLLRDVLNRNKFIAIKKHLKAFQQKVNQYRESQTDLVLFDPNYSKEEFIQLKRKLKGSINYGEPTVINEWINESFFNKLVDKFLGEQIIKKPKRRAFYLRWNATYSASQFDEFQKDVRLNELNPDTALTFKLDLVEKTRKEIFKGLDFDSSERNVRLKINELEIVKSLLFDYQIAIVYPKPRTKEGKEFLSYYKKAMPDFTFVPFNLISNFSF